MTGSAVGTGGMLWLAQIDEHSSYLTGLLGPMMVTAAGMGMMTMPLALIAMSRVPHRDAGLASSLLNTGQQVGGSIGLAVLGSVVWTVVADSIRQQAAAASKISRPVHGVAHAVPARAYNHALATGFSHGFEIAACAVLLALIVTLTMIRVKREDLPGTEEQPAA